MTNNNYASKINNIMDKAKEDVRTQIDRAYQQGYADAKSELGQNAIDLAHEESDRAYQQGLEDAWEAARKLALSSSEGGLDIETVAEIFDGLTYYAVLKDVSALEAISKIKEYEEKQEQFAVGDEVYNENDKVFGKIRDEIKQEPINVSGYIMKHKVLVIIDKYRKGVNHETDN